MELVSNLTASWLTSRGAEPSKTKTNPPLPNYLNRARSRQMSQDIHFSRLHLLENLPGSLPYHNLESTQYSFSTGNEDVEEYDNETSGTNHRLEVVFDHRITRRF